MLNPQPPRRKLDTIKVDSEVLSAVDEAKPTVRLGAWLVRRGLIDRSQLFAALNRAFSDDCRLGDAIVLLGFLPRNRVEREAREHSAHCAAS